VACGGFAAAGRCGGSLYYRPKPLSSSARTGGGGGGGGCLDFYRRVSGNMSLVHKLGGFRSILQFDNRWQLVAQRLLFSRTDLHVYRIKGMEILVEHSAGDVAGIRECFTTNMYQQYLDVMDLRGRAGGLRVLDCGSHIGSFSLLLQATGHAIKQLACVELNPVTFSRLRFNIEHNLPGVNATLLNAGVAGESGEMEVMLGTGATSDSLYRRTETRNAVPRRVKLVTMDEVAEQAGFGPEPIDLCKLDVEGAEYQVFARPGHSCLNRCRYLLIEVHPMQGQDPKQVLDALKQMGFVEVPAPSQPYPDVYCFRNQALAASGAAAESAAVNPAAVS
jgi:FkbM family methyltransferase